jgi:hypothetical protein
VGSLYILNVAAAFWPNEILNSFQAYYVYVNFVIILHVETSQWNSEYSASLRIATKYANKTSVAAPAVFIVIFVTERKHSVMFQNIALITVLN